MSSQIVKGRSAVKRSHSRTQHTMSITADFASSILQKFSSAFPSSKNVRTYTKAVKGISKFQAVFRGFSCRKKLLENKKKQEHHRHNIAKEILLTEEKYVSSLGQCIEHFMDPLLDNKLYRKPHLALLPAIPQERVKLIFSNIKSIYSFHKESILEEILPRMENWNSTQSLGDIFVKIVSVIKIYTEFISNFSVSSGVLKELAEDSVWNEWKDAQQSKLGGTTLRSLLILPIQRVPRYVMLLKDLLKHTPLNHPDRKDLQKAHKEMKVVTAFLEKKKDENERLRKLYDISSMFQEKVDFVIAGSDRTFQREDSIADGTLYTLNDCLIRVCSLPSKKKGKPVEQINHSPLGDLTEVFSLEGNSFKIFRFSRNEIFLTNNSFSSPKDAIEWLKEFKRLKEVSSRILNRSSNTLKNGSIAQSRSSSELSTEFPANGGTKKKSRFDSFKITKRARASSPDLMNKFV